MPENALSAADDHPTTPAKHLTNSWADAAIDALMQRQLLPSPQERSWQPDEAIDESTYVALLERAWAQRPTDGLFSLPSLGWPSASTQPASDQPAASESALPADASSTGPISRSAAIVQLVERWGLIQPLRPNPILSAYFDDAAQVPPMQRRAIAAAALGGLVVSHPDVCQLQPREALTWGAAAALLCQALGLPGAAPQYVTWFSTLADFQLATQARTQPLAVPFWRLRGNGPLVQEIQAQLQKVQLYPPQRSPDGRFSLDTQTALMDFCQVLRLPNRQTYRLDGALAQQLQALDKADVRVDFRLQAAQNRDRIFREYLRQEAGYDASHLAFLDKGIDGSPLEAQVEHYPTYLRLRPTAQDPTSQAASVPTSGAHSSEPNNSSLLAAQARRLWHSPRATPKNSTATSPAATQVSPVSPNARHAFCLTPQSYPKRGVRPTIAEDGLAFLHPDIEQACLCVGQFVNQQLAVSWLGRKALVNSELWSATKVIPLLHLVSRVHTQAIQADIDNLVIRAGERSSGYTVHDLAVDMVNYEYDISSSNALAAMFKLFATPQTLEQWVRGITGNSQLSFRGNYGEGPFIGQPVIWDQQLKKVLLTAAGVRHGGPNSLSVYDLTRLITMLGWHPHLEATAQLPRAQWKSLESVVRALGRDSARYIDAAIDRLGLRSVMQSPVVVSKMGFGYSTQRRRTELVYSAFVQFVDTRPQTLEASGAAPIRSFGLTLLAAKQLGDGNREARLLDARLAAEVTEILRRLLLNEWG